MEALASVFGIDVLTYAIMSNHMHLILRNRPDVVATWSDREVAIRWLRVFPGRRLEEHLAEPTENDVNMLVNQPERLLVVRERLSDISWFMRALSEPIARLANQQDECTGRFWEGRFKALRIVDETGLLACAMYVDLNPIRAAMADSLEKSTHTSVFDRIQGDKGAMINSAAFDLVPMSTDPAGKAIRETPVAQLQKQRKAKKHNPTGRRIRRDDWLSPLTLDKQILSLDPQSHSDGLRASDKGFLSVDWAQYYKLLRWTAKQGADGVAAEIPADLANVLTSRQALAPGPTCRTGVSLSCVRRFKSSPADQRRMPSPLQGEARFCSIIAICECLSLRGVGTHQFNPSLGRNLRPGTYPKCTSQSTPASSTEIKTQG